MIYQGKTPVREIIVHCSATRPDWYQGRASTEKFAEIKRWHTRDRGWRDIGYHWLIDRDGTILRGRPESQTGAHVAGRNRGTLGVCLIGGHGSAATDMFSNHFTADQEEALKQLIRNIKSRTDISKISGHNEYAAKACPGFHVPSWVRTAAI